MPRIARMPHVYHDKAKSRHFVEKRVPPDVHAIIGGKAKWKHTFPQSVDRATADRLALAILDGWEKEWDAARPVELVPVIRRPRQCSRSMLTDLIHLRGPNGISRDEMVNFFHPPTLHLPAKHPGVVRDEATGQCLLRQDYPRGTKFGADRPGEDAKPALARSGGEDAKLADASEVVTPESVIAEWKRNRERAPGPEAIRNKQRAVRRLFDWLNAGHTDMARVTTDDLQRFKTYLQDAAEKGENAGHPRDTITDLRALFRTAKDERLLTHNPSAEINLPPKRQKRKRVAFTTADRRNIISKARQHPDPVIRITTLIEAFLGAHTEEIIEASTRDIEVIDGVPVLHIRDTYREPNQQLKTDCRERSLPLHSAIWDNVRVYWEGIIEAHGHGPLFPDAVIGRDRDGRRNTLASNRIMKWMRSDDGPAIKPDDAVIRDSYCWRKTVRTILANQKVDPDRARFIIGHAAKDIDAAHYLEHELPELVSAIELIDDPAD